MPKKTIKKTEENSPDMLQYIALAPVVSIFVGIILNAIAPWRLRAGEFGSVLGLLAIIGGLILVVLAVLEFKKQNSPVLLNSSGFKLVTDGIYKFSRNPAYAGLLILGLGFSFSLDNVYIMLLQIASFFLIHKMLIPWEEKELAAKFKEPYKKYSASVRRWF